MKKLYFLVALALGAIITVSNPVLSLILLCVVMYVAFGIGMWLIDRDK